jgi:hypothetical protein
MCIGIKSLEVSVPKKSGCVHDRDCQIILKVSKEENGKYTWMVAFNSRSADQMSSLIELTNETIVLDKAIIAAKVFSPIKLFMAVNTFNSTEPMCNYSIDGQNQILTKEYILLLKKNFQSQDYTSCIFIIEPKIDNIIHLDEDNLTVRISVANDKTGETKTYFAETFQDNHGDVVVRVFDLHQKRDRKFDIAWVVIIVIVVWAYSLAIIIILTPYFPRMCPDMLRKRDFSITSGQVFQDIEYHHDKRLDIKLPQESKDE